MILSESAMHPELLARERDLWAHADNAASQRVAKGAGHSYQPDRGQLIAVGERTWPTRWYARVL
jgi:RimJ/RimL family protein N-acetyltransferase